MEKAVVRRGIGAVVLALIAALLLGYLLKGKAPQRSEVAKTELKPSEIQIFPQGGDGQSTEMINADGTTAAVDGKTDAQAQASGEKDQGLLSKAAGAVSGAVAGGAKLVGLGGDKHADGKSGSAATNAANAPAAGAGAGSTEAQANAKGKVVDPKTGNAATSKGNVVVDGAGQAEHGNPSAGAQNTPGSFVFRPSQQKEVRPSVSGGATLDKGGNNLATTDASASVSKPKVTSNAKLVGEKSLPPVGVSAKVSSAPATEKKVASSKDSSTKPVSRNTTAAAPATAVATAAPSGRNKYVVQLLATSNATKANSLRDTMKQEGYAAFVSTTTGNGKTLYRVRIGSFDGKSSAVKKLNTLKRRYRQNKFIQSSIVVPN